MARRIGIGLALFGVAGLAALVGALDVQAQQQAGMSPQAVRQAALAAGVSALSTVPVPQPTLELFLEPGQERLAIQLGKALFWDMAVGSDGNACGSCHFHAGADSRVKNQVNPATKSNTVAFGMTVTPAGQAKGVAAAPFAPNYTVKAADFPLHIVANPNDPDYDKRVVLRDSKAVISSQGVLKWTFNGVEPGAVHDLGKPEADTVFHVGTVNARRVEPRNTPTTINAIFNHDNFWDGRAQPEFNGINPFGMMDESARILVVKDGAVVEQKLELSKTSLASQAVGPPLSADEMSYVARSFPDIGRKVAPLRPLATQQVHAQDSVLAPLRRADGLGLANTTYADMIRAVFKPMYWNSAQRVQFDGDKRTVLPAGANAPGSYSLLEANFALFFGLAIQLYEATLVSDKTPFDAFMEGDDRALGPDELRGLLLFINRGLPAQKEDPVFAGIRVGNCVACHGGAELSLGGVSSVGRGIHRADIPARMNNGRLEVGEIGALLLDKGFANIGVRPTAEDIGRGDRAFGRCLTRQPLCGHVVEQLVENAPPPPQLGVDGAFKIPGLRNVELTGPFFHNGGQATLEQVIEFYARIGDFADVNVKEIDAAMARIALEPADTLPMVKFLLALTDERVRNESAPFDRPQIQVPNGHPGDTATIGCANGLVPCEEMMDIPAVGAAGRKAQGLAPLAPFLNLPQFTAAR